MKHECHVSETRLADGRKAFQAACSHCNWVSLKYLKRKRVRGPAQRHQVNKYWAAFLRVLASVAIEPVAATPGR